MTSFRPVWHADLGRIDFQAAHALQLKILEARVSGRIDRDVILALEHPPVFTMGRRGNREHLKVSPSFLHDAGINLLHIERGGDITFHGPGQLVLYPIFQLRRAGLGVVEFVEKLEEVMLRASRDLGVSASRDPRNHGVWVGDRKMGFVGIAVRRSVSFHGLALNVNLPLEPFSWIDPCGLENVQVTSLNLEADGSVDVESARTAVMQQMEKVFAITLTPVSSDRLKDLVSSTQS